jgi:hypothetical protein
MRKLVVGFNWLLLAACTHHPVRIDCDQHLIPINPPHAIVKPAVQAKAS